MDNGTIPFAETPEGKVFDEINKMAVERIKKVYPAIKDETISHHLQVAWRADYKGAYVLFKGQKVCYIGIHFRETENEVVADLCIEEPPKAEKPPEPRRIIV